MKKLYILASLIAIASLSSAQQQPAPCSAPEYQQFDFWLGEWNVFENNNGKPGSPQGASRVTSIFDGCAIQEEYLDGKGTVVGKSLNAYYPQTKKWHQMYVDGFGQVIMLSGKRNNNDMSLDGEYPSVQNAGLIIKQNITWTRLNNNEVRQHWILSTDNWQSTRDIFDGLYIRKNP
jgi:hypothetical protein